MQDFYNKRPFGYTEVKKVAKSIERWKDKKVLIAGCGCGRNVLKAHFYGGDVTAIDGSESALEVLQENLERLDISPREIDIRNEKLEEIDLEEEKYDYILCTGVIQHLEQPEEVLERLQDGLKPDGRAHIDVYNSGTLWDFEHRWLGELFDYIPIGRFLDKEWKKRKEWGDKYQIEWKTYSMDEIEELVKKSGFTVEEKRYEGMTTGLLTGLLVPEIISGLIYRKIPSRRAFIYVKASK